MSDLISASAIQDSLTECSVCKEYYDEVDRIPRRMPCCVQSICQPCLDNLYNRMHQSLRCPMCRHEHHLPSGVTSLPKEAVILKILDHLKIQKRIRLSCTDCPDSHPAEAQCDNCGIFLCGPCQNAHVRNVMTKNHTIVSLEEIQNRPVESFRRQHQCTEHQQILQFYCKTCDKVICGFCTVVDHKEGKGHNVVKIEEEHTEKVKVIEETLSKLDNKKTKLKQKLGELKEKADNFNVSVQRAEKDTNKTFDNLIQELQKRRASLLSNIKRWSNTERMVLQEAEKTTTTMLAKVISSTEYTRQIRRKADKIEDLGLIASSVSSLSTILNEEIKDVKFARRGLMFVPDNVRKLTSRIKKAGQIKRITFKPTVRPNAAEEAEECNAISIRPSDFTQGSSMKWDCKTSSDDVTVSGSEVTNTQQVLPPVDTGCRIKSRGRFMTSSPLVITEGQRYQYHVKVRYTIKQVTVTENKLLFESALTNSPVDGKWNQLTGLSVLIVTCPTHKQQLCLSVRYDGNRLADVPLCKNQVDVSRDLHLCFLLDGDSKKIHVVDVDDVKVVKSVTNVVFDRPLWVMGYVANTRNSDITCELIPENKITVSQRLTDLLSSFQ